MVNMCSASSLFFLSIQWHGAVNLPRVCIYPASDIPQLCEPLQQHGIPEIPVDRQVMKDGMNDSGPQRPCARFVNMRF